MPEVMIYLLKVNLSVILFYLGYRLLLRRLTFYTLNRFYLLFSLIFSFTYPLVDLTNWLETSEHIIPTEMVYVIPDWQQVPTETFDWWTWLLGLIGMGTLWCAVRLTVRLLSLWRIHRQSQPSIWQWFRYRQVFGDILPFSFWQHIYVNIHNYEQRDLAEIFKHEQVHVDGLHTFDVLLAELGSVFSWFNPGIWLMRTAVRENLEFITDRKVLLSGIDKKAYQYSLLSIGKQSSRYSDVGNGFNFKSLKRRIMMMNKRNSSRLQLGKYVLVVPVIAAFVLVFTVSRAYEYQAEEPVIVEDSIGNKPPWWSDLPSERLGRGIVKVSVDTAQAQPLILVDGEAFEGDLKNLSAETIESIDVLKEKSAIERYGSRGKNGVILITSKKGRRNEEKPHLTTKDTTIRITGYKTTEHPVTIRKDNWQDRSQATPNTVSTWGEGNFGDALIVIDGEAQDATALRSLSPSRIDAVHVWKGKSGEERYGEKGANGVIEITTKSHNDKGK
ncbi:M56 family metallopeptidase [Parapedobacter indicus]|uniref:TonB-dependent outer membrane receptor, SusC/RagA subfamily, signature region n=1 Tax=Parapedobacter indicus TaxID=1477437 RepID=A0A1I3D6P1_9SPHI|nr:M56 family metallopeptidase [Parapedobacter indicus]PPL04549.1 TonB-dependent SusC/RagA subfamily outer membrane receptor [Parapedobacter indicus]SFH82400.1 TonB-dependent outer membrane receptor, SusC/RagA subfamily, signature region [Parapedobacter indicus]